VFVPSLWAMGRWLITLGWFVGAGWISNSVAGYLHRIFPFLAWHSRYWGVSPDKIRTSFQEMVSQKLGRQSFYLYNLGVGVMAAAIWGVPLLYLGVGLLAVGTWLLVFNLGRVYVR